MRDAEEIGLSASMDIALYCVSAMVDGPKFATTEKWSDILLRVKKREIDMRHALSLI